MEDKRGGRGGGEEVETEKQGVEEESEVERSGKSEKGV